MTRGVEWFDGWQLTTGLLEGLKNAKYIQSLVVGQ